MGSRQALIGWVNELLDLDITKIEQCGSGAVYCQIFDSIYGDIPMSKVNFAATAEYQYLTNFKVLQACFIRHGIDHEIPVTDLIKCKFQDNLAFLQWAYKFWSGENRGIEYDPVARRGGSIIANDPRSGSRAGGRNSSAGVRSSSATRSPLKARPSNGGRLSTAPTRSSTTTTTATRTGASRPSTAGRPSNAMPPPRRIVSGPRVPVKDEAQRKLEAELQQYKAMVEEIQVNCDQVLAEREFYFDKCREIEILVQETATEMRKPEESTGTEENNKENLEEPLAGEKSKYNSEFVQFVEKVEEILYRTTEGFCVPEGEQSEEIETF